MGHEPTFPDSIVSVVAQSGRGRGRAAVAYAEAALRFLARRPPELEEVRVSLKGIVATSHQADDVIDRTRAVEPPARLAGRRR